MRNYYRDLIKIDPPYPIVQTSLRLYLDAASASSFTGSVPGYGAGTGSTWYDLSGNGIVASFINGPTFSTDNGGRINLDGTDDWITVLSDGSKDIGHQSFTIDLWVRPLLITNTSSPGQYTPIWSYDFTSHLSPYYAQHIRFQTTTSLHIGWNISGGPAEKTFTYTFTLGTWYNIVWTRNSSNGNMYLYINSATHSSGLFGGTPSTISYYNTPLWLGRHTFTGYSFSPTPFKGNYGVVKFYSRPLNYSEISTNYNLLKSRYGY